MRASNKSSNSGSELHTNVVEGAAISASLLCLVHCLALPFLLPGIIGTFAQSATFHYVALVLIVPSALAAFLLGYKWHGAVLPALIGLAGLGCLVIVLLPGARASTERWFTVTGSLFLVTGHIMNWRLRSHAH